MPTVFPPLTMPQMRVDESSHDLEPDHQREGQAVRWPGPDRLFSAMDSTSHLAHRCVLYNVCPLFVVSSRRNCDVSWAESINVRDVDPLLLSWTLESNTRAYKRLKRPSHSILPDIFLPTSICIPVSSTLISPPAILPK